MIIAGALIAASAFSKSPLKTGLALISAFCLVVRTQVCKVAEISQYLYRSVAIAALGAHSPGPEHGEQVVRIAFQKEPLPESNKEVLKRVESQFAPKFLLVKGL